MRPKKTRIVVMAAVLSAACTALVLGVSNAFTSETLASETSNGTGGRPDPVAESIVDPLEVAPGSTTTVHVTTVVDGGEWSVSTFENVAGDLCLSETVPGEGVGTTCMDPAEPLADGPLYVTVGARQMPETDDLTLWDNIWVSGVVADAVSEVELVLTSCGALDVEPDEEGVFLFVLEQGLVHDGVWPLEVVAYDAEGEVVAVETIHGLEPPPNEATELAGTEPPAPSAC